MLIDLHVKTKASDGTAISLKDALKAAKDAKVDGVAICETLASANVKETIKEVKAAGLAAFVGVEIPTDQGILLCFPSKVDKFLTDEQWRELTEFAKPAAKDVIELVTSKGGVVIASRPYDISVAPSMGDAIFELDNIAAVEVFNSRIKDIQADFALEAGRVLSMKTVGGSDPTTSAKVVGQFATLFKEGIKTQKAFVEALKDGEYWAVRVGAKPARSHQRSGGGRDRNDRGGNRRNDRNDRNDRKGGGNRRNNDRKGGGGGQRHRR